MLKFYRDTVAAFLLVFIAALQTGGPASAETVTIKATGKMTWQNALLGNAFSYGQIAKLVLIYDTNAVDSEAAYDVGSYVHAPIFFQITSEGETLASASHGRFTVKDGGDKNDSFDFVAYTGARFKQDPNDVLVGPAKNNLPLIIAGLSLPNKPDAGLSDDLPYKFDTGSGYKGQNFSLQYCSSCGTGGGFGRGVRFQITDLKVITKPSPHTAITLTEDFEDKTLPDQLVQSASGKPASMHHGTVLFWGGYDYDKIRHIDMPDRSYVRTAKTDFAASNFVAEVTIHVWNEAHSGSDAFFGLGNGQVKQDRWREPAIGPRVYAVSRSPEARNAFLVTGNKDWSVDEAAGMGTHRLRMLWDAASQQATFAIHKNYTGGRFVATTTSPPMKPYPPGFDYTNASIFFSGAEWLRFDDLSITLGIGMSFDELKRLADTAHSGDASGRHMTTQSVAGEGGFSQAPRQIFQSRPCNQQPSLYQQHGIKVSRWEACSFYDLKCDGDLEIKTNICLPKTWGKPTPPNGWLVQWDGRHQLPMPKADPAILGNVTQIRPGMGGLPADGLYIFVYRSKDATLLIRRSDRPKDVGCFDRGDPRFSYSGNPDGARFDDTTNETPHMFVRHTQLNGGPDNVWSAGQLEIRNREIIWISNESGHFAPHVDTLHYVGRALREWQIPVNIYAQYFDDRKKETRSKADMCSQLRANLNRDL